MTNKNVSGDNKKGKSKWIMNGFVIMNYLNQPWSTAIYDSDDVAREYLNFFWNGKVDWSKFTIQKKEFKL